MRPLLLVVFLIELVAHLVNTVGATTINNLLWNLFLLLPTETSKNAAEKRTVQQEYLKTRKELNATSSQDEFAKWAKIRRTHDKLLEKLEKIKASHDATKTRFESSIGMVRWTALTGVKFLLPMWNAKQPMFWLPQGWFPYYIEWVLSLPRAPLGSVSIASWQVACSVVILLVGDTITAILGLLLSAKVAPKQPIKVPSEKGPAPEEQTTKSKKDS